MSTSSDARKKLTELLTKMIEVGASDLHLRVDSAPQVRVNGKLKPLEGYAPLGPEESERLACSFLSDDQAKQFEQQRELDFSIGLANVLEHADMIMYDFATFYGPDHDWCNADPSKAIPRLRSPERLHVLAPGEKYLLHTIRRR